MADGWGLMASVEGMMEVNELEVIHLELKYCERCGGLWLRQRGAEEVYCLACAEAAPEFPRPRKSRRNPRLRVHSNSDIHEQLVALFCREGGHA